ncbi:hypothetical protein [Actinoplanes sp. NPDC026619]|uniref:hypothetical protein n=1 Tax=Actinoplanes sp. NPDC026619 TaxID=3155798 RepID=UPI0033DD47C3
MSLIGPITPVIPSSPKRVQQIASRQTKPPLRLDGGCFAVHGQNHTVTAAQNDPLLEY